MSLSKWEKYGWDVCKSEYQEELRPEEHAVKHAEYKSVTRSVKNVSKINKTAVNGTDPLVSTYYRYLYISVHSLFSKEDMANFTRPVKKGALNLHGF